MPKLRTASEDEYAPRTAYRFIDGAFHAVVLDGRGQTAHAQLAWSGLGDNAVAAGRNRRRLNLAA